MSKSDIIVFMIDLSQINYKFSKKPIVFGGKAMEYYGLRKSGQDMDLIATIDDIKKLAGLYPTSLKDLWGDFGVCVGEFEIWKTIVGFDYQYWLEDAIELKQVFIISKEKLMLQKALAIKNEKYLNDLNLITQDIISKQAKEHEELKKENDSIVSKLENTSYIEKS